MNLLDWILLAVGLFCIGRGIIRGAISQIFGIAGILAGFLLASHYYETVAAQLSRTFPKLSGTQAVGFILLFFLTWFCVGVVGYLVSRLLARTGLGFLDRLWGGMIGFAKALAIGMVLISVLTLFLPAQTPILRQSVLAPYVQEIARFAVMAAPDKVQKIFNDRKKELERYWTGLKEGTAASEGENRKEERKRK